MNTNNTNTPLTASARPLSAPEVNYSEIPGLNSPSIDVLNQFQANLKLLADLHFKLQFVLSEIKSTTGATE